MPRKSTPPKEVRLTLLHQLEQESYKLKWENPEDEKLFNSLLERLRNNTLPEISITPYQRSFALKYGLSLDDVWWIAPCPQLDEAYNGEPITEEVYLRWSKRSDDQLKAQVTVAKAYESARGNLSLALRGLRRRSGGKFLTEKTVYEWKHFYLDFAYALEHTRGIVIGLLNNKAVDMALNGSVPMLCFTLVNLTKRLKPEYGDRFKNTHSVSVEPDLPETLRDGQVTITYKVHDETGEGDEPERPEGE